eukprot:TRINITY_DN25836_c0_g1_i1.p1 TRINITY_DN25836_c0_g1~~TRINITY_DN25836_c0_g1_i1.p1  ORF type:complete len:485 (+),score=58.35 TRINITY_DN25836_c0_g1_i1:133-1587(+)
MKGNMLPTNHADETRAKQAKKKNKIVTSTVVSREVIAPAVATDLERAIANLLSDVAPSQVSIARGERCFAALQNIIRQQGGHQWKVLPFGSFANGFGTVTSDLDVTCCDEGHTFGPNTQREAVFALTSWILPILERHPAFSVEQSILNARIPIVKLRFENELAVDLSCHNPLPLRNTRLLRAYALIDQRVRDLGIAIKLWAKASGVCDATQSNLSSYSFTLLCIYFMQVHPDVLLPVLPVNAFAEQGDHESHINSARSSWKCTLSLVDLIVRFFEFYSGSKPGGFSWGHEVVSVRFGCRLTSDAPVFSKLRGRQFQRMHIEDPYQLERNLHAPLGSIEEEQLRHAVTDTLTDIEAHRLPAAFGRHANSFDPAANEDLAGLIRQMKIADLAAGSDASTRSVGDNTICSDEDVSSGKTDGDLSSGSWTLDSTDIDQRSSGRSRWNRRQGLVPALEGCAEACPPPLPRFASDLQACEKKLISGARHS